MWCETQLIRGLVQCPACMAYRVGYPGYWIGFAIETMKAKLGAKKPNKITRRSAITDSASPADELIEQARWVQARLKCFM